MSKGLDNDAAKMKPTFPLLAILILGLVGCKDSEAPSKVSPELATEISRIQAENALSDEEISTALERWAEMYAGAKGLLESEDLFGSGAWTPERFAELMTESEKALKELRHQDQMLAAYSLGHLSALNDKRYDDVAESLRGIIVRYYASAKDNPNEVGENFLVKVHELADSDSELKRLLGKSELGEDAGGKRD